MISKEKIQQAIIEKALTDPVFKKQLMTNANLAVKKALKDIKGIDKETLAALEKMHFKVEIEKKNEIILALPREVAEERELSKAELKKVVGGAAYVGAAFPEGAKVISKKPNPLGW